MFKCINYNVLNTKRSAHQTRKNNIILEYNLWAGEKKLLGQSHSFLVSFSSWNNTKEMLKAELATLLVYNKLKTSLDFYAYIIRWGI